MCHHEMLFVATLPIGMQIRLYAMCELFTLCLPFFQCAIHCYAMHLANSLNKQCIQGIHFIGTLILWY